MKTDLSCLSDRSSVAIRTRNRQAECPFSRPTVWLGLRQAVSPTYGPSARHRSRLVSIADKPRIPYASGSGPRRADCPTIHFLTGLVSARRELPDIKEQPMVAEGRPRTPLYRARDGLRQA
jgi:hypothetical protein